MLFSQNMIFMSYRVNPADLFVDTIGHQREGGARHILVYVAIKLSELFIFNRNKWIAIPHRFFNYDPHVSLAYQMRLSYAQRWAFELQAKSFLTSLAGHRTQIQADEDNGVFRLLPGCEFVGLATIIQRMLPAHEVYQRLHISYNPVVWGWRNINADDGSEEGTDNMPNDTSNWLTEGMRNAMEQLADNWRNFV